MSLEITHLKSEIERELDVEFEQGQENRKELLEAITIRVNELLKSDPGLLFSYLYRLDVLEHKVRQVMSPDNNKNPAESLAFLILERQLQRLKTKVTFKQKPIDGWEW